ncbi:MAG TPA: hypothetical protein VHL98_05485 [Microvirga sp.]|nr:hypothetical protein [Microvirga sp.]
MKQPNRFASRRPSFRVGTEPSEAHQPPAGAASSIPSRLKEHFLGIAIKTRTLVEIGFDPIGAKSLFAAHAIFRSPDGQSKVAGFKGGDDGERQRSEALVLDLAQICTLRNTAVRFAPSVTFDPLMRPPGCKVVQSVVP